jgi:polysaccharide pyruvyl transferase WcaK-like protein
MITVRDLKSQMYLLDNGIQAELVSDPVFSVDFPIGEKEEVVGVQLRAFRSIDDAFLFTLARQVITYFGDKAIELYVFQESIDYEICKKFEKMLKTISPGVKTKIIHNISGNDMILKISRLEYMIAMRFHAVLVSIKTGVKTLAINYDAKVEKLAYDAFLPLLTISIDEDMDPPFERLLQLNPEDLMNYCANQQFEWEYFDNFFV